VPVLLSQIDAAIFRNCYARRLVVVRAIGEIGNAGHAVSASVCPGTSRSGELLNPNVDEVRHVEIAGSVDSYIRRMLEMIIVIAPAGADGGDMRQRGAIENLNLVIDGVRHIDVRVVHGHARRLVQAIDGRQVSRGCRGADIEDLNTVVACVRHIQFAVLDGKVARATQLVAARAADARLANGGEISAVRLKYLDAVIAMTGLPPGAAIADVNIPLTIESDASNSGCITTSAPRSLSLFCCLSTPTLVSIVILGFSLFAPKMIISCENVSGTTEISAVAYSTCAKSRISMSVGSPYIIFIPLERSFSTT